VLGAWFVRSHSRRRAVVALAVLLGLCAPSPMVGPARAADPVLVGAGDIASCTSSNDEATAALLDGIEGTVFTLGDNAYEKGTAAEFANCYGPTWGRHKARTRPSVGNHEYYTAGASGYFGYFGDAAGPRDRGWYSYDTGGWHVVVLNDNCDEIGGCGAGSPQEQWLRADLAANTAPCTVAYFSSPRFSSGTKHGNNPDMQPFWQALYDDGAELVMGGDEHHYERFAPQTPVGAADPSFGIRHFTVGTGGRSFYSFGTVRPNSEVRNSTTHGVLKLTLHPGSYDWEFVPVAGKTFTDRGTGSCHGAPSGGTPPSTRTVSFGAAADAHVAGASPTANFGTAGTLLVDGSPVYESYLRFSPSGLTGTVVGAKLRLFATDGSGNGPEAYATGNEWVETGGGGLTFENRPGRGALLDDKDSVAANTFVDFDVTPLVRGNGDVSFNLVPDATDGTDFNSREAGGNRPLLMVTTTVAPGPDTTPPQTTITSRPADVVNTGAVSYSFTADEPASTFTCTLDGVTAACTSPQSYTGLADGPHEFRVAARDGAGNEDESPATDTFTVDTTAPVTTVFGPEADARVEAGAPDSNRGTDTRLRADGSPREESYLRFPVAGISGPVRSAKLRLFVVDGTVNGPEIYRTTNAWTETGITYNNRPSRSGAFLDDKGSVASNTFVEFDVTPFVTGNGTFSFALVADSGDALRANAREASGNRPQLVITTG
jgi:hypothetical protein